MEKFLNLPTIKQNAIINAALLSFGTNGYKKASISDIATAAGISKAMIFHYFGTKKDLYYYLIDYCGNLVMNEVSDKFDNSITDFFDRIIMASNIKLSVLKLHPAIYCFLNSVYFEENEEVRNGIKAILQQSEGFRNKIAFDNLDVSKFKDGIDVHMVMKMLLWLTEGAMSSTKNDPNMDMEVFIKDIFECIYLLKNNLYKA